jgi:hypothetical protein
VFHRPLLAVRTQSACNHPGQMRTYVAAQLPRGPSRPRWHRPCHISPPGVWPPGGHPGKQPL